MIVTCSKCLARYDDEFRSTICPHDTFAANDGQNNFAHHPDAYLKRPDEPSKDRVLWHQSGVNKHGEPFVQLLMDGEVICQLDSEQARDHAKNILEATEASEQDAFMLSFMQEQVGLDIGRAMQVIVDFRKWREARGKKGPPSDPSEFMRTNKHEKPQGGDDA